MGPNSHHMSEMTSRPAGTARLIPLMYENCPPRIHPWYIQMALGSVAVMPAYACLAWASALASIPGSSGGLPPVEAYPRAAVGVEPRGRSAELSIQGGRPAAKYPSASYHESVP